MNAQQAIRIQSYVALSKLSRPTVTESRNSHSGRIFIIGSGPSVNMTDLSKLDGETIIYLNNAVSLRQKFTPAREFAVISDHLRLVELRSTLARANIQVWCTTDKVFSAQVEPRFFSRPSIFVMPKLKYTKKNNTTHVSISESVGFSEDLLNGVYLGKSVVFPAIQLAYHLGAAEICLVGIDMTGVGKTYFDNAIKSNWDQFDYKRDGRPHFMSHYARLKSLGVSLVNMTVQTAIDVLPHDPMLKLK